MHLIILQLQPGLWAWTPEEWDISQLQLHSLWQRKFWICHSYVLPG